MLSGHHELTYMPDMAAADRFPPALHGPPDSTILPPGYTLDSSRVKVTVELSEGISQPGPGGDCDMAITAVTRVAFPSYVAGGQEEDLMAVALADLETAVTTLTSSIFPVTLPLNTLSLRTDPAFMLSPPSTTAFPSLPCSHDHSQPGIVLLPAFDRPCQCHQQSYYRHATVHLLAQP